MARFFFIVVSPVGLLHLTRSCINQRVVALNIFIIFFNIFKIVKSETEKYKIVLYCYLLVEVRSEDSLFKYGSFKIGCLINRFYCCLAPYCLTGVRYLIIPERRALRMLERLCLSVHRASIMVP